MVVSPRGATPPAPVAPPQTATAPPSAPTHAVPVQRKASQGPPPTVPTKSLENNSDGAAGRSGGSKAEAPNTSRNNPSGSQDTATDDVWLQRHAHALYPHIRYLLRNEFLLDRERRGRLMRDD